jgi:hypothetical protein
MGDMAIGANSFARRRERVSREWKNDGLRRQGLAGAHSIIQAEGK